MQATLGTSHAQCICVQHYSSILNPILDTLDV